MSYAFYLDDCLLPVTPSSLQIKIKNQNKTINLINEGEINVLKSAGLSDIEIEALLPQFKYPFAEYDNGFKPADFYLNKLKTLKTEKRPFQFICSRVAPDGNLLFGTDITVSLEDYSILEDAKNGFDIVVDIKLKEYKFYGTKIAVVVQKNDTSTIAKVEEPRPAQNAPNVKSYSVEKGDTLWNIAKKYLGDGAKYTEVWELNKNKIDNPNLIYEGQILTMP